MLTQPNFGTKHGRPFALNDTLIGAGPVELNMIQVRSCFLSPQDLGKHEQRLFRLGEKMTHREGFSFIVWRGTFLRSDDTLELDSSVRSLPILACTRELPSLFFLFSSFSFFYLFFLAVGPMLTSKCASFDFIFPVCRAKLWRLPSQCDG